jgi:hypothetical protein
MSEEDVVAKVGEMMQSLDEVRKYRELAYALIDFAGIMAVATILALLVAVAQGVYAVMFGFSTSSFFTFFSGFIPAAGLAGVLPIFIVFGGFLGGVVWIGRRVDRVKTGEWKETLDEGVPGAVKLLTETDWDSLLSTVSLSKVAFALYALVKIIGYFLLIGLLLSFGEIFVGGLVGYTYNIAFVTMASVILALLANRKNLEMAFKRLRSLDLLFWDLRWFYSEFKQAEFNKT